MRFEWDDANILHLARHDITPEETQSVVENDPVDLRMQTVNGENRFEVVGLTKAGHFLIVVLTWKHDVARVVTAWSSTSKEKREYDRVKGPYGF